VTQLSELCSGRRQLLLHGGLNAGACFPMAPSNCFAVALGLLGAKAKVAKFERLAAKRLDGFFVANFAASSSAGFGCHHHSRVQVASEAARAMQLSLRLRAVQLGQSSKMPQHS